MITEISLDSRWQDVWNFAKNILAGGRDQPHHEDDRRAYFAAATNVHVAKRLHDGLNEVVRSQDALRSMIMETSYAAEANASKRALLLEERLAELTRGIAAASLTLSTSIDHASKDSEVLSRRVYWLNVFLLLATVVGAVAAAAQAYAAWFKP